jgi:hypothetical protein
MLRDMFSGKTINTHVNNMRGKLSLLVLDCDNTRYVILAGFKRESIDFPGYPLPASSMRGQASWV